MTTNTKEAMPDALQYAELLESDSHIGTEEKASVAATLRTLHAKVAALTAAAAEQAKAIQRAIEVLDWLPTHDNQRPLWDKHQAALAELQSALTATPAQPAPGVESNTAGAAPDAVTLGVYCGIASDDVTDPTHPRYVAGFKAGHAAGKKRASHGQAPAGAVVTWAAVQEHYETLADFREGQWWVNELDAMASHPIGQPIRVTPDMRRAVAVVHNLLRAATAQAAPAATHEQIAAYLEATGAYVTNDASREAAIADAVAAHEAQAAPANDLHPKTADLVQRFAASLAEKLAAAEKKYGYSDGWASPDWMDECRQHLNAHIAKGDPRDVAAYCAFLWHHGASTAAPAAGAVAGPDLQPLHNLLYLAQRQTSMGAMQRVVGEARLELAKVRDAAPTPAAQADSGATPSQASIAWNALRDATDPLGQAGVSIMQHVRIFAQRQYEAGLAEGRADSGVQEDAARGDLFRHFNGMCWPVPGERLDDLNWAARYSHNPLSMSERLCMASVLSAYSDLISRPAKERDALIKELRQGPARSDASTTGEKP